MRALPPAPVVVDRMLRHALMAALLATVLATVAAGVLGASWLSAAGSALAAGGVVTASLAFGLAAVRWLLTQQDAVVLPGAFVILFIVVALLLAVAFLLRQASWVDRPSFALSALGTAVAFQVALVWSYLTGPRPLLDVAMPGQE